MTDSKQNPEVNPGDEGEVVTLSKEEHNKLVEENANLTQDKSNLVGEITELREKKQLTEDEKAELTTKVEELEKSGDAGTKVETDEVKTVAEEVVSKILSQNEAKIRKETLQKAMDKFVQENPQFSKENDEGGLKKSAFDKKLTMFNLDNLKTEDEFLIAFKDANSLLGGKPVEEQPENNIPAATDTGNAPDPIDIHELSAKEVKIVNDFMEGDKEKYIKIKAKRPDYVASLLRNIY